MSIVICKLPRAGLGNQLFPLLKAYTFAHLNHLPVIVINYHQIKPGPWLRSEKNKRNYRGFFVFQKNWLVEQLDKWRVKHDKNQHVIEPELKLIGSKEVATSYIFSEIPNYAKRFDGLKENRQLVIKLFYNLISPSIKAKIENLSVPCIGVHIRMGDFRKLKEGEEFGKVGTVRTPESYFINTINSIRKLHGSSLPVSIFTDGRKRELSQLFDLPNIHLIDGNNDFLDLILLSKSKIIVTSTGSTFSYWAAFISNAPIIMHPSTLHHSIRTLNKGESLYEGTFDVDNLELVKQIKMIES